MSFKIVVLPFRERMDLIRKIAKENQGKKLHRKELLELFGYSRRSSVKQSRMYQMGLISEKDGLWMINRVKKI